MTRSRLSNLTLLNLLGLIEVGKLAVHMKTSLAEGIDSAMRMIDSSTDFLGKIAQESGI